MSKGPQLFCDATGDMDRIIQVMQATPLASFRLTNYEFHSELFFDIEIHVKIYLIYLSIPYPIFSYDVIIYTVFLITSLKHINE